MFERKNYLKLIIFIPATFACIIDLVVTAINQNPEYWLSNLNKGNELNPVLSWAMQNHVLGLFLVTFLWLFLISIICLLTPIKVGRVICLAIVLGNSWGAGTWISHFYGFWFVIALVVMNSFIFITFYEIQNKYID